MLTHVVTLTVYSPQTRETHYRQVWLHAGPFDDGELLLERLEAALVQAPADWYEVIESRHQRTPEATQAPWDQLELFRPTTPG